MVPWTSFSENEVLPNGSRPTVWFAFDETPDGVIAANAGPAASAAEAASSERRLRDGILSTTLAASVWM